MGFAVIFDMDGTLIDDMVASWIVINRLLQSEYGFQVPKAEIPLYAGRSFKSKQAIWREKYGMDVDLDDFYPKYMALEYDLLKENPVPPKGLIHFLEELVENHVPLAVATSSRSQRVGPLLALYHLEKYFPVVVTSRDVVEQKPSPELFLVAAKRLDVDPKTCIVLEDVPTGIEAGKNAGMKVIALRNPFLSQEEAQKADLQIDSFAELSFERLKKWLDSVFPIFLFFSSLNVRKSGS